MTSLTVPCSEVKIMSDLQAKVRIPNLLTISKEAKVSPKIQRIKKFHKRQKTAIAKNR